MPTLSEVMSCLKLQPDNRYTTFVGNGIVVGYCVNEFGAPVMLVMKRETGEIFIRNQQGGYDPVATNNLNGIN
jgi:hypothetical protein